MQRKVKRVPLDFDWPLGVPWGGYENPYIFDEDICQQCDGTGLSNYALDLKGLWYQGSCVESASLIVNKYEVGTPLYTLAREVLNRAVDTDGNFVRKVGLQYNLSQDDVVALWREGRLDSWGFPYDAKGQAPSANAVNKVAQNSRGLYGMHDLINMHIVIQQRCQMYGQSATCTECHGGGVVPLKQSQRYLFDTWQPIDPPVGDGYQLWSTIQDGVDGPLSPVFSDEETFIQYLIEASIVSDCKEYNETLKTGEA